MRASEQLQATIRANAATALAEDVGSGDLTAGLLPEHAGASATIICREDCVLAGTGWANEVFRQVDESVEVAWDADDGAKVAAGATVCRLVGSAQSILTSERCALNFLQLLSSTATETRRYVDAVAGTATRILDTRKTLPGLRLAQKYAVVCGGGDNHRIGLFDAILIKENHIASAGGIAEILQRVPADTTASIVEIEVETLADLRVALDAGARRIMLDNFTLEDTAESVRINRELYASAAKLEASGGKTLADVRQTAKCGVDFISVGALTKNVRAIDLSMLISL